MKFTVQKEVLLPALERMASVGKGEKKGYEEVGLLFIKDFIDEEHRKGLLLASSNGYIKAVQRVVDNTPRLTVLETGESAVSAEAMRNIVKSAPDASLLEFATEEKSLTRKVNNQKRKVSIPTYDIPSNVELKKIDTKNTFHIDRNVFVESIRQVLPWAGTEEYRPKYRLVYVEFRKEEVRFVCGDGSKFVILRKNDNSNNKEFKNKEEYRGAIIQSEQAGILAGLFDEAGWIKIHTSPSTYTFETDCGLDVMLDGIPREYSEYVPYSVQIDRLNNKIAYVDIDGKTMAELVADLEGVRDPEWERRHNCIKVNFGFNEEEVFCKSQFSNSLDYSIPIKAEMVNGTKFIDDVYSLSIFGEIAKLSKADKYRFSFMGENDIVFCEFPEEKGQKSTVFFSPIAV